MEDVFYVEGYKLLIVDDNAINRRVVISQFKSYKFDIDETDSGFGAIELCKAKHYDMILMDHMMPEMDGIEATRIIKEQCGNNVNGTVFVALTANSGPEAKGFFLDNGFDDFLEKPVQKSVLFDILNRWIDDGRKQYYAKEAEADSKDTIKITNVNVDEGIKKAGGSLESYMDVLDICLLSAPKKLKTLKSSVEDEEYDDYELAVHTLKSSLTNIGAFALADMAGEHEDAVKAGNYDFIKNNYNTLLEDYKNLIAEIQSVLDSRM